MESNVLCGSLREPCGEELRPPTNSQHQAGGPVTVRSWKQTLQPSLALLWPQPSEESHQKPPGQNNSLAPSRTPWKDNKPQNFEGIFLNMVQGSVSQTRKDATHLQEEKQGLSHWPGAKSFLLTHITIF